MKEKGVNIFYSLVFQFLCIPALAFLSYLLLYLGNYFLSWNVSFTQRIILMILVIGIILLNVALVYGIAYVIKNTFKTPLNYHIIIGLIVLFILLWVNVYFSYIESVKCDELAMTGCVSAIRNNKIAVTVFTVYAAYYLIYILTYKIVLKKEKK